MGNMRQIVDKHYAYSNSSNWDGQREILSESVITLVPGSEPLYGIDGFIGYAKVFWTAAPDASIRLDRVIAETDNSIVVEGTFTGTHTGPLMSPQGEIPATGKRFELPFCDIFVAEDGKTTEHHVWFDQVAFLGQLGLLPEPAATR